MIPNIYIIANNYKILESTIDKIDIKNHDIIILCNKILPNKYRKINLFQNKYIFLRSSHLESYWGMKELMEENSLFYAKIICVNNIPNKINILQKKYVNIEIIDSYIPGYPKGRLASTGFIAYNYAKKYLGDNITLVGFDGKKNHSPGNHNFAYEYDIYNSNRVQQIKK
jgi:hypothetical protein